MLGLAEGTEAGYQLLEIVRAQPLQGDAAGVYVRSARCFGKCAVKVAQKSKAVSAAIERSLHVSGVIAILEPLEK
jgi:hypothetical protein